MSDYQQVLMNFVKNHGPASVSSRLMSALCQEALGKIYEGYLRLNNREHTLSFYSSLLDSPRYRGLYPYVYYYLGAFQGKDIKEKYLLKSLRFSLNDKDRQFALARLFLFYKQERVDYLGLSYLLKLIELQKLNHDYAGLETSYLYLGELHENKRDYLAALDYYFEALVYSQKSTTHLTQPGYWRGYDKNHSDGKFIYFFYRLFQILAQKPRENRSGYIYLNISNVFRILNRKELAKMYIKKTLDYAVQYKKYPLQTLVYHAYSKLYYEEDDYADALKYISLSLSRGNPGQEPAVAIQSLFQKARILLKMAESGEGNVIKNTHTATALLKIAVDLGLKNKKYDGLLPIMCEYIERLLTKQQFSKAKKYLDRIDDTYAPYYPTYFFYYYLKALLARQQGEMNTALQFYRQTIDKLEQFYSSLGDRQYHTFKQKIEEIYSQVIEFYLEMYNRTNNQAFIKKALYFSEIKNSYIFESVTLKSKTYNYLMAQKKKLEQEFLRINRKYISLLKTRGNGNQDTLRFYENKLEDLKNQNGELMELILESPLTYKKYKFKDFNLSLIQQHLNPRQLLVKYAVLKESVYIFCIDYHSTGYWRLPGSAREIMNKVKQLSAPLDDFTEGNVDYLRINYDLQLANQLYDLLVKGIWEFRSNIEELFIIPDGELFKLPFEALVMGFNHRELDPGIVFSEYASADYLVEKLPISYSFSLFHFQDKIPPGKPGKYAYDLTGFGCPLIRENSSDADHFKTNVNGKINIIESSLNSILFRELPSSKQEIEEIPHILGEEKARVFIGKDFNRKTFEMFAPQSRVIHLATHFISNLHYPQYSALLFSPLSDTGPFYYAHEIFNLKLSSELVVLSACESSEKHLLGLQGLRGMTASFKQAGVRSMMVSMWPVDEHSSKLTSLFYREYNNPLHYSSTSAALRAAKLRLMKQTTTLGNGLKISFAHPFIWANFILFHFR